MSATDFCGCDSSSPHHELGYLNGSSLFGFCSIATDVQQESLNFLKCHGRNRPEIDMDHPVETI
jgi:hypothetical protein